MEKNQKSNTQNSIILEHDEKYHHGVSKSMSLIDNGLYIIEGNTNSPMSTVVDIKDEQNNIEEFFKHHPSNNESEDIAIIQPLIGLIKTTDEQKHEHFITIGKTRYGMSSALYDDLFDTYNGIKRKQVDFKYSEYLFPNLREQAISLFGNEIIIYNRRTTTQSEIEFIKEHPYDREGLLKSIIKYNELVKENISELLDHNYDLNFIYTEAGVGVIHHLKDYYKNNIYIELLRNEDIEDLNISTSIKTICLDCMSLKEPQLILNKNFDGKKLILILNVNLFPIINQGNSKTIDNIDLSSLPTEEEFKKNAWELKEQLGIKLTAALNQLAKKYGYNSFNAIKPKLSK